MSATAPEQKRQEELFELSFPGVEECSLELEEVGQCAHSQWERKLARPFEARVAEEDPQRQHGNTDWINSGSNKRVKIGRPRFTTRVPSLGEKNAEIFGYI